MPSKRHIPCAGKCGRLLSHEVRTGFCQRCYNQTRAANVPAVPAAPVLAAAVTEDREKTRLKNELATIRGKYKEALNAIETQEQQLGVISELRDSVDPQPITPKHAKGTGEGTVVAVLSDWHSEELVGEELGGLNVFNPDICTDRVQRCFRAILRLTDLLKQDIRIDNILLALLGDFITGQIHGAENAEKNAAPPMHAIVVAQNHLISGIDFLLAHSDYRLTLVCNSGNHARTTFTTRFASENGHSLEYLLYCHLEAYYHNEPRVTVHVAPGMHSYQRVYDTTIRFQHGHAIKYGGGVGGIYIPVNKAISQWNKARVADLDVFGHFHQLRDGGNFLCNGSLIGYNSFAQSIKADFEEPKQLLFLIDKKRGRTCTWPILCAAERQGRVA